MTRVRRVVLLFSLFLLPLALAGCGGHNVQQKTTTWDLDPLHQSSQSVYHFSESGADRGEVRFEILHQMMNGREVIIQRRHLSGAVSGMTETVFDSKTFAPLYLQKYEETEGILREVRLDYSDDSVKKTVSESLFGGTEKTSNTELPPGTLDESQLLTAIRAWPLESEQSVAWRVYSLDQDTVGQAVLTADSVKDLNLAGVTYRAQQVHLSLFGEVRNVWVEEGSRRRILLVEGPDSCRLEIEPS